MNNAHQLQADVIVDMPVLIFRMNKKTAMSIDLFTFFDHRNQKLNICVTWLSVFIKYIFSFINSGNWACFPGFFKCDNGLCVLRRCDGKDDCKDNSDERNCGKLRTRDTFPLMESIMVTKKLFGGHSRCLFFLRHAGQSRLRTCHAKVS